MMLFGIQAPQRIIQSIVRRSLYIILGSQEDPAVTSPSPQTIRHPILEIHHRQTFIN